jgi:sensor histidine kinase regulating citrate/malate metabolism
MNESKLTLCALLACLLTALFLCHRQAANPQACVMERKVMALGIGLFLLTSYFTCMLLVTPGLPVGFSSLCICLSALPLIVIIHLKRIQNNVKDQTLLELQQEQIAVQENALEATRELRHEITNELALVSAYIQMGLDEKALQSVEFIAARLADRYNYVALPKDAWLTTINAKQQQASRLGVQLITFIEADDPTSINEQRLLPMVAANLLDNAFEAVAAVENPQVLFLWRQMGQARLLSVRNNGPAIPSGEADKLFDYGYSSKTGHDKGWGLAICKRIATELGGELLVSSNPEMTDFTLFLPAKCQEHLAEVAATSK